MGGSGKSFWFTSRGVAAAAFVAAAIYFLIAEHRAHVVYALPYLILLLCPVMHVVMHRGHRHDDHSGPDGG